MAVCNGFYSKKHKHQQRITIGYAKWVVAMLRARRSPISSSVTPHDCTGYFTIFKRSKNIELDTLGSTSINFYICMVNSSGHNTSGMYGHTRIFVYI